MRASPIIAVALFLAACPDKPTSGLPDASFIGEDRPTCTPECSGRTCGLDPICGRSCGSCDSDETCSAAGACVQNCTPGCGARQCGVDDCGTSCGSCDEGSRCEQTTGACVAVTGLRIEGVAIPNSNVVAVVGAEQFQATADAMGAFGIDLGVQDGFEEVIVSARGIGADDFIELASIAGDIETLTAHAGADRVVNEAEDHGLIVNPISTAHYAGIFAANLGRIPDTRTGLEDAEKNLDEALNGYEAFQVACAIRLLIDRTGPTLPASHETTLELAKDLAALWQFVDPLTIPPIDSSVTMLDVPAAELFQDPATAGDIADLAPGARFQDLVVKRNGFPGYGGARLELAAGAQGSRQRSWGRGPVPPLSTLTWSIDQKTLKTEYTPPVDDGVHFFTAQDIVTRIGDPSQLQAITAALEPAGGSIDVRTELLGEERSFTARGKTIESTIVRQKKRWHFDEALAQFNFTAPVVDGFDLPYGEHLRGAASITLVPFTREQVLGTWAMRLVVPADNVSYLSSEYLLGDPILFSALINFRDDGTASGIYGMTRATIDMTWSLDVDGRLTITMPTGETQTYERLAEAGAQAGVLMTYSPGGGQKYTDYDRDGKVDDMLVFTGELLASDAGEFWQTSVNNFFHLLPSGAINPDNIFGWIFDGSEVATRLLGDPGTGVPYREESWNWRVRDGVVEVEQRIDQNHARRCTYDDPSCIAVRRRTWVPLTLSNGRFTVLEFEGYLRERSGVVASRFQWDPTRGAWIDPMTGNVARAEDFLYGIEPRANAYVTMPIP